MRIFIITMDDPVYTVPFFKEILEKRHNDVVGLAVPQGDRLTIGKNRSKTTYLLSLLLIMGLPSFMKYSLITYGYKLKKKLSGKVPGVNDPSIIAVAKEYGIPTHEIKTPNSKSFRAMLRELKPDVIINQSQSIIKKELLEIPTIGVLNRHNALLPKNRGRLTPFWVMKKGEKETGVSIHFVDEGIDSGQIVVQEKFPVEKDDTFNTIVRKNYTLAAKAMLKALDVLERGDYKLLDNPDDAATYNTVPTFKDALQYRASRLKKAFS
ncbi:MAG: formyltransferase family protein [Bacteroidia bacterium]